MHISSSLLLTFVSAAVAFCPMKELAARGLISGDLAKTYERGEGLSAPHAVKRQANNPPVVDPLSEVISRLGLGGLTPRSAKFRRQANDPPLLDPLSEVLSPLGLGGLTPRSARPAHHNRAIEEHVRSRLEERDEEVDIDAAILTPKAHKRHVEERGLVGGILGALTGTLAALDVPTVQASGLEAIPGNNPDYQYIAPTDTDIRGTCPTLNTLANHGYISRNGVTTFAEAANAIQTAYSMSFDLAVVLSALGLLAGGDIPTGKYSIGGQTDLVPSTLGSPVLGIDRHGLFEIDASISRGDRYFGDNHSFNITRWNKLVSDANTYGDGLFNINAVANNAAEQVEASRAENPEFAMGGNFAVIYATRALLSRPLANGTDPDTPNFNNVAPFYLNETFPDNWYRIPNSYSLVDFLGDVGDLFLFSPQPLGANVDGAFVPLNITIPDAAADIGCLGLTLAASAAPDEAEEVVQAANDLLDQILSPLLQSVNCNIADYDTVSSNAYTVEGEDTDAGSGSGITRLGEWDSQTEIPTGLSSGNTLKKKRA